MVLINSIVENGVKKIIVFPNNPGRTELSDEVKTSMIEENKLDLSII